MTLSAIAFSVLYTAGIALTGYTIGSLRAEHLLKKAGELHNGNRKL